MRALLVALDAWVTEGKEPPPSRYPGRKDGTLVSPKDAGYPGLPGLRFEGEYNEKPLVDHASMPPKAGPEYPVSVAKVDADGHAIAAIRLPAIEAPTATYLGWNLRKRGFAEGAICGLTGSTIPLAATKADRERTNDRRLALEERYATHADYVAAVRQAANRLREERLLLPTDADRMIKEAETKGVDLRSVDKFLSFVGWHPEEKAQYGERQHGAWETVQRGHAVANGCFVIAVNRTGFEPDPLGKGGIEFWGQSFIAGTDGRILVRAPVDREVVLVEEIDLAEIDSVRAGWPFFRDRRIDAYANITQRFGND